MFTQSNTPALESREAGGLIKATELKGIQGIDMYITLFGDDYLAGVELLERQLRKMSRQDECLAGWRAIWLSNDTGYFAPDVERITLSCPDNDFEGELSGNAAGIVLTLFDLNHLMWFASARKNTFAVWALTQRWDALKDYAETLDEAALIFRAID